MNRYDIIKPKRPEGKGWEQYPVPVRTLAFCQSCSREQWNEAPIYAVPLCYLCIPTMANDPTRFYHLQCRLYVVERELEEARRTITRLQSPSASSEPPR